MSIEVTGMPGTRQVPEPSGLSAGPGYLTRMPVSAVPARRFADALTASCRAGIDTALICGLGPLVTACVPATSA